MNKSWRRSLARRLVMFLCQFVAIAACCQNLETPNEIHTLELPFSWPSPSSRHGKSRKVFAHYFPPYPISIDNAPADSDYYTREYLAPDGEHGKHLAYGGFLRDRPMPQQPLTVDDWELENLKTEIRQAIAGGIDGFTVDLLSLGTREQDYYWESVNKLMTAAQIVDANFKIVLMPDTNGQLAEGSVTELTSAISRLAGYSSTYRLSDGRLVVMPFHPEAKSPDFWRHFVVTMRERYAESVALIPTFVSNPREYVSQYAGFSYAMSHWGGRNPAYNDPNRRDEGSYYDISKHLRSLGLKWIQPISFQDARPYSGVFDEALNTANLRNSWQSAREANADFAHVITWNDYSEGSHFAPSVSHGPAFVQVNAYYAFWFKNGRRPRLKRNMVILTNRSQFVESLPIFPQSKLMKLAATRPGLGVAPADQVEVLLFLKEGARVTLSTGARSVSSELDAGVRSMIVPLGTGLPKVTILQSGRTIELISRHPVSALPLIQDLQYYATSVVF